MKRWALAAVAIAVTALTAVLGMQPVGAAGSGDINPWALQAEDGNVAVPLAQAKIDAGHFNVIIAHAVAYSAAGEVKAMKTVNTKLKVLMYMNGTFGQAASHVGQPGPATDYEQCPGQANAFSPTSTWYETDNLGHFVTNKTSHNCLMIPTNPLWIQNRTAMCETEAKAAGYDGCYLDDLGLGPLKPGYLSSNQVINPSTHAVWTSSAWLTATANIAKGVHAKVSTLTPKLMLFGNGLTDGPSYYPPANTKQILAGVDAGISEGWLRQASAAATAFPSAAQWLQNVKMLGDAEAGASGKPILTLTKLWSTSTSAQQTQWLQYSLASFLLGTGGKSMFFFSPGQSVGRTTFNALYLTALGTPSALMATGPSGTYTRKFASGFVVVNPGTATVTVPLGGTYFTTAGCGTLPAHTKETSLPMAKDTGCVLTLH
jgi:hypothetical protein